MSVRALVRRGYDLGLLSPAQYRTANIHLVKTGQAKVETYDADGTLQVEQPELLPSALIALDGAVPGGAGALASQVGLAPRMLELVTGARFPEPEPTLDDPKVVRLRPIWWRNACHDAP